MIVCPIVWGVPWSGESRRIDLSWWEGRGVFAFDSSVPLEGELVASRCSYSCLVLVEGRVQFDIDTAARVSARLVTIPVQDLIYLRRCKVPLSSGRLRCAGCPYRRPAQVGELPYEGAVLLYCLVQQPVEEFERVRVRALGKRLEL